MSVEVDLELENNIKNKLAILNPSYLELIDESYKHVGHAGVKERGGRHYKLIISSTEFQGLPLIKKHQLIYRLLNDLMQNKIHALSITAKDS